jgi:signal transduction histidine kinase
MRSLVGALRDTAPALQLMLLGGARSGQLSRETLERLGVHGYVLNGDGPDRILQAVDAAIRTAVTLEQARASDRLKTELLASVSHELRSPLHIILGYLELAREGAFGTQSDALRSAMDKMVWNAGHLLELVEDFLDMAKCERTTMKTERIELGALVRALVTDNELLIHGRPITLRARMMPPLPLVLGDAAKVRVVLQNLLTNALKFTEQGEVVVTVEAGRGDTVDVHVRDTGPGIPAGATEHIFDLFHQLRPGDPRTKGLGLGLALARRFARAMGGDVTLVSVLDAGSTFTLTLPAWIGARAAVPSSVDAAPAPLPLLR